MIAGTQKNHHRRGTHRCFNTLIATRIDPDIFQKHLRLRRTSLNQKKIYQNPSQNLKWLVLLLALLSLVLITLIFYETEQNFNESYSYSSKTETVRGIILILCICQSLTVLVVHMAIDERFARSFMDNFYDLFRNMSRFKYFFMDVFISMIHTPPGIYATLSFTQLGFSSTLSYSDIIFPLSLLRIKFVILFISQQASESSKKSILWGKIFQIESHILFVIKCFIRKWTYSCFIIIFGVFLVLLGINLRVFEKHLRIGTAWDKFWLSFTTESTVGYGEYVPRTHIGRLFAGIGSVIGVFIFSYSVTAFREISSLSTEELKLASFVRFHSRVQNRLLPKAALLVQKYWKAKTTKKLKDLFRFIEFRKDFKLFRLCLNTDLSISLEQQLENSGKMMNKVLKHGKDVFFNVHSIENTSKVLLTHVHKNYSKMMKVFKIPENLAGRSSLNVLTTNRKSGSSATNAAKMRKEAVKNLFARKVNSPSAISPSLSCSSID